MICDPPYLAFIRIHRILVLVVTDHSISSCCSYTHGLGDVSFRLEIMSVDTRVALCISSFERVSCTILIHLVVTIAADQSGFL